MSRFNIPLHQDHAAAEARRTRQIRHPRAVPGVNRQIASPSRDAGVVMIIFVGLATLALGVAAVATWH